MYFDMKFSKQFIRQIFEFIWLNPNPCTQLSLRHSNISSISYVYKILVLRFQNLNVLYRCVRIAWTKFWVQGFYDAVTERQWLLLISFSSLLS
jgi:hypothetical protein